MCHTLDLDDPGRDSRLHVSVFLGYGIGIRKLFVASRGLVIRTHGVTDELYEIPLWDCPISRTMKLGLPRAASSTQVKLIWKLISPYFSRFREIILGKKYIHLQLACSALQWRCIIYVKWIIQINSGIPNNKINSSRILFTLKFSVQIPSLYTWPWGI